MRADAVRDAIGLTVDDAHALIVDAERFGGDLRHHGLKPLPERRAAGDHFDRAGFVDFNPNAVLRSETRLLDEHRQADADHFAVGAAAR